MGNINKGTKITTAPISYEIEILDISREVPKDQEIDFMEWLSSQTSECSIGKSLEYYSYTENYKDDIAVTFYIKSL